MDNLVIVNNLISLFNEIASHANALVSKSLQAQASMLNLKTHLEGQPKPSAPVDQKAQKPISPKADGKVLPIKKEEVKK